MKKYEFIEYLLLSLENELVQKKLIDIISDAEIKINVEKDDSSSNGELIEEIRNLKELLNVKNLEIDKLNIVLEESKKSIEILEGEKYGLEKKNNDISNKNKELKIIIDEKEELLNIKNRETDKLNYENKILNEKIDLLNGKYNKFEEIYGVYNLLVEKTREELKGIYGDDGVENFLFRGIQYQNIEMLWEYMRNKIIENDIEDINKVNNIFTYFFDRYNELYNEKIYSRMETSIGDEFDNDLHVRLWDSSVSGKISNVILEGYINNNTGRIEKKSLVEVRK
ncbi:hypothetical protein [Peptacetobacter sp. AB845]|uniref:hypothetical protein n=1 Tax=Peptacetobacter sp. AB845 TaxID=3388429 RepID=UPI0039C97C6D